MTVTNLHERALGALMESDPAAKCLAATRLFEDWSAGKVLPGAAAEAMSVPVPGRPALPELVHPRELKQRKLTSPLGRAALLHAISHIEFNAINLALDAAYRFRDLPAEYYGDWLQVAAEEAFHFTLLVTRLRELGHEYGDFPAHNGLWVQALRSEDDVLRRMALVPRVYEARGLDVTPGMMARLAQVGETRTVEILEIILRDEIGHVKIGNRWYYRACEERGLEPVSTFREMLDSGMAASLIPDFNYDARIEAGFTREELEALEASLRI